MRKLSILCDCDPQELRNLAKGIKDVCNIEPEFGVSICNQGHGSFLKVMWRYWIYFKYAYKIFINRKKYQYIMMIMI